MSEHNEKGTLHSHVRTDNSTVIATMQSEITRLKLELAQAREAVQTLNAGRPLGDIVGLHTAQLQMVEITRLKDANNELVELLTDARDDVSAQLGEYQDLLPYKKCRYDAQKETLDKIDAVLAKAKGMEQPCRL